jgi:hypothetical protein
MYCALSREPATQGKLPCKHNQKCDSYDPPHGLTPFKHVYAMKRQTILAWRVFKASVQKGVEAKLMVP